MGQVLHGCATTTEAVRRAIQHGQESLRVLAKRYGVNPKTVAKWRHRTSLADRPTGPTEPRSTVLCPEQEAVIVAFRRHTLPPLDDCLCALQATIPNLSRSSLHRCLQRHGIGKLPDVEGEKALQNRPNRVLSHRHCRSADRAGRLFLFVAIDRTSKFALTQLHAKTTTRIAGDFLRALVKAVPDKVHTVLTDNGIRSTDPKGDTWSPAEIRQMLADKQLFRAHSFELACALRDIDHRLTKPGHPWTTGQVERMNRTIKEATVRRFHYDTHDQLEPSRRLCRSLQFRQKIQNAEGPHTIRVHLQNLALTAATLQRKSDPANAGTKHLIGRRCGVLA